MYSFVRISVSVEKAFLYFFSLSPFEVFKGLWFVPKAVPDIIKNRSARLGSERLIYFHDGSTVICRLLGFESQVSFCIYNHHFTSGRFGILESMCCHFSFVDLGFGMTQVCCRYQFKFYSKFYGFLFELFLKNIIRHRLDIMMSRVAKEMNFYKEWEKGLH